MFLFRRDTNTTFILRVFPVQRLSKVHLGRRAVVLPRGGERHVDRDPHRGAAGLLQDGALRHRGSG